MNAKSYYCSECNKFFSVVSALERKEIPCPSCGKKADNILPSSDKGMSAKGDKSSFSIIVNGVVRKAGTFKCRACSMAFSFDVSYGNRAACPRCRGDDCEPTSPSAVLFTGSKIGTLREKKRTRYLCDTWKSVGKIKEYREGFRAFLESLELSEETKRGTIRAIDAAIAELEAIRIKKAAMYEKVTS
jgi:Zn finger protein HypA/HybF involved in hydrogenase expression